MKKLEDILPKGLELQSIQFDIPKELKEVSLPDQPGVTTGIEETIEAVLFAVLFANALNKTFADGKVTFMDLPYFFNVALKLPAAISKMDKIPGELIDMSDEEYDTLMNIVMGNLELTTVQSQVVLQKSLYLVYAIYDLVKAVAKPI